MRQETTKHERRGLSAFRFPPSAFTLVELLVVIAIIGILAGLLLVGARAAIRAGRQAQVRAEVTQFATALENYKNSVGSYPPNTQVDTGAARPHLDNALVLANFKRHFNKAFPNQREPAQLIEALVGASALAPGGNPTAANQGATNLPGGMNAAEALVFWLGGFSDDPKYPISGPGGPAYSIESADINPAQPNEADPIDSRSWELDINITQLGPREQATNFFPANYARFIDFWNPRTQKVNRINFWYLKAPNSEAPYVYFDASRGSGASGQNDTPAATRAAGVDYGDNTAMGVLFNVHAIKAPQASASATLPFTYANDGKFQILHSGIDDTWGSFPMVNPASNPPVAEQLIDSQAYYDANTVVPKRLVFPEGPWTQELADTLSNLGDGTLEDNQP